MTRSPTVRRKVETPSQSSVTRMRTYALARPLQATIYSTYSTAGRQWHTARGLRKPARQGAPLEQRQVDDERGSHSRPPAPAPLACAHRLNVCIRRAGAKFL